MNSGARESATWTCRPIACSGEKRGTTLRQGTQPLKIWVCKRGKVQKRSDTIDQNEHGDPERHSLLTAITNYRSDRGNDDRRCPGGQALHCLSAFHLHRGSLLTVRGSRDGECTSGDARNRTERQAGGGSGAGLARPRARCEDRGGRDCTGTSLPYPLRPGGELGGGGGGVRGPRHAHRHG